MILDISNCSPVERQRLGHIVVRLIRVRVVAACLFLELALQLLVEALDRVPLLGLHALSRWHHQHGVELAEHIPAENVSDALQDEHQDIEHVEVRQKDSEEHTDHEQQGEDLVVRHPVREDGVEAENVHEGVEEGIHDGHAGEELLEVVEVVDFVHLVQLAQDEVLVLEDVEGHQHLEDQVQP